MKLVRKLPKAALLTTILAFTLLLDFIMYSFLSACPACASFSSFITTQSAISAPILASLSALFALTHNRK